MAHHSPSAEPSGRPAPDGTWMCEQISLCLSLWTWRPFCLKLWAVGEFWKAPTPWWQQWRVGPDSWLRLLCWPNTPTIVVLLTWVNTALIAIKVPLQPLLLLLAGFFCFFIFLFYCGFSVSPPDRTKCFVHFKFFPTIVCKYVWFSVDPSFT